MLESIILTFAQCLLCHSSPKKVPAAGDYFYRAALGRAKSGATAFVATRLQLDEPPFFTTSLPSSCFSTFYAPSRLYGESDEDSLLPDVINHLVSVGRLELPTFEVFRPEGSRYSYLPGLDVGAEQRAQRLDVCVETHNSPAIEFGTLPKTTLPLFACCLNLAGTILFLMHCFLFVFLFPRRTFCPYNHRHSILIGIHNTLGSRHCLDLTHFLRRLSTCIRTQHSPVHQPQIFWQSLFKS
jgi:hypothetical protein